jgi:hypothetical protein
MIGYSGELDYLPEKMKGREIQFNFHRSVWIVKCASLSKKEIKQSQPAGVIACVFFKISPFCDMTEM